LHHFSKHIPEVERGCQDIANLVKDGNFLVSSGGHCLLREIQTGTVIQIYARRHLNVKLNGKPVSICAYE
jgi:hypothetical protein